MWRDRTRCGQALWTAKYTSIIAFGGVRIVWNLNHYDVNSALQIETSRMMNRVRFTKQYYHDYEITFVAAGFFFWKPATKLAIVFWVVYITLHYIRVILEWPKHKTTTTTTMCRTRNRKQLTFGFRHNISFRNDSSSDSSVVKRGRKSWPNFTLFDPPPVKLREGWRRILTERFSVPYGLRPNHVYIWRAVAARFRILEVWNRTSSAAFQRLFKASDVPMSGSLIKYKVQPVA